MQTAAPPANPWSWIPTLYFGQALPYVAVIMLSAALYTSNGVSNRDMTYYTGWLYLPWVIKPLWSPVVELFGTKRRWIVVLQLLIGATLASVALTTSLPSFVQISLAIFWLAAFTSATHDIAADGFYMLGLQKDKQAAFVGVRSTFYKLAMIAGQGGLLWLAGTLTKSLGTPQRAWAVVFLVLGALLVLLCIYHQWRLPKPAADRASGRSGRFVQDFIATFAAFFRKKDILVILGFILLFRFGEAQLLKLVMPFMLDSAEHGGLQLSLAQYGLIYGSIGAVALTLGGLLGGYLISLFGLKRCLWPMMFAVHGPNLVFVYLATALPGNIYLIAACVTVEQFGYGLGLAAYLLYMIMVADGPHKTAHYAICTGFMALGMMLPGMASGQIEEWLGYRHFFIWACLATLPAFGMAALLKIDAQFGKRGA